METRAAARSAAKHRRRPRIRIGRDLVLFWAGVFGIVWVTVHPGPERPALVTAFVAMMGLPVVIRRDEAKRGDKDG